MQNVGATASRVIRFGPFEVDVRLGELRKHGSRLRLQEQPFRVLSMLLERPGDLVTREELRQRLWAENTFVDFDHGLNAAINRLRERLGDEAENPRYIETIPRRGYRFLAPVEVIAPAEQLATTPAPAPSSAASGRSGVWVRVAIAGSLLVLVTLATWLLLGVRGRPAPARPIQSLAVLPLANYSGDPTQDYFADGMTEALTTQLSQIRALKVISRTSAMRYRGTTKSVPEIARELGVDAVVEGSVVREGDQVRINVQLIEGSSDRHLWSDHYQREARHVLALQSEIAQAIADQVRIAVTPAERARLAAAKTVDPRAYEAYLTGRYHWNRWDRGLDKAIPAFERATELDPAFAPAYANLALCYDMQGFFERPRDLIPKAKAAALKALELDPNLAEAHAAAGDVALSYDWDLEAGDRERRRAVELDPNSTEAHRLAAYYLISAGHLDEAIAEEKRAVELDPFNSNTLGELAWMHLNARHYDEALTQYRRAIELEPNHRIAQEQIAWIYTLQGRYPEAYEQYQKMGKKPCCDPWLGYLHAVAGRRSDALRVARRLEEAAKADYVDPYIIAIVYAGLGDKDHAFAWLDRAYDERSAFLNHLVVENFFDSLHSDPRFAALARRMGLPLVEPRTGALRAAR